MGASIVKWTSYDLCLVFSESDSKLYTYFEFCEEKIMDIIKNMLIYITKQIMMTKKFPRKVFIF